MRHAATRCEAIAEVHHARCALDLYSPEGELMNQAPGLPSAIFFRHFRRNLPVAVEPRVARSPAEVAARSPAGRQVARSPGRQ
eukprot:117149-Prymnesium_polylepis.1